MAENSQKTARRNPAEHLKKFQFKKGGPSPNSGGRPKAAFRNATLRKLGEILANDPEKRSKLELITKVQIRQAITGSTKAGAQRPLRRKARELRHVSARPRPAALRAELLVLPPEERNGLMKSRLRQFLRSPLRFPVVHLAESAGAYALRVLFLGGGTDHSLGRERPQTSGVVPGQIRSVSACSRAAFLHAGLAAALAKAPTNNLLILRRENRRASPQATNTQAERVNLQVRVDKSFVELYAEFIGASREYVVTESVNRLLKREHDFQSWLRQQNHSTGEKWSIQKNVPNSSLLNRCGLIGTNRCRACI